MSTSPVDRQDTQIFGKRKSISELKKIITDEDRQEFQLSFDFQSSCCSHRADEDEDVGCRRFPCDLGG